jgi:hypothetical protein
MGAVIAEFGGGGGNRTSLIHGAISGVIPFAIAITTILTTICRWQPLLERAHRLRLGG